MSDRIHQEFDKFSRLLTEINASNLPSYKDKFFHQIGIIAETLEHHPDKEKLEDEFFNLCSTIDSSIMHRRTRKKPLGYAGDFKLIDWIYTQKTAPSGNGKLFDMLFHSFEAAESVRNRKDYFIKKCLELSGSSKSRVDILNLGCGSCRDVVETYQVSKNGYNIYFHCIDHEPKAIEYAKKLLTVIDTNNHITFDNSNIFRLKTAKQYDLIWSAGLFDYLEDRVVILLLKKVWRNLKKGGHIVFGNFSPENPTRKGMELVGKWYLIHRSANDLIRICNEAKIPFSEINIESEPNRINLFCNIKK